MKPVMRLILFAMLLAIGPARPAMADELRPGYIELKQEDTQHWKLVWKAPMRGGVKPETQPLLPKECSYVGEPTRELLRAAVMTRARLKCSEGLAGKQIGLSNFSGATTDALIRYIPISTKAAPQSPQAHRLTATQPTATIAEKAGRGQVAWSYFIIGIEHIVFGIDHLLFVLCLVFLISGGWTIVKTVTAFTLAHSVTLAGVTLGWFGLPQQPVEVVIALSIVFLAVEILKKDPEKPRLSERIPWVVAFLFGLLHGFGFAGALNEIGLPEGEVPMALLTFNIGVEAGQLAIVLIAVAALAALRRYGATAVAPAVRFASYAIGILASFWFIERLIA